MWKFTLSWYTLRNADGEYLMDLVLNHRAYIYSSSIIGLIGGHYYVQKFVWKKFRNKKKGQKLNMLNRFNILKILIFQYNSSLPFWKGRKTAEKNGSTSFRVLQAHESWSKYTTNKHCSFWKMLHDLPSKENRQQWISDVACKKKIWLKNDFASKRRRSLVIWGKSPSVDGLHNSFWGSMVY